MKNKNIKYSWFAHIFENRTMVQMIIIFFLLIMILGIIAGVPLILKQ